MIVMRWPRPGRLLASQAWVLVTRWAYHDHHEMASAFKLRCKSVSLLRGMHAQCELVPLLISAPAFQISNQAVARSIRFHFPWDKFMCSLYAGRSHQGLGLAQTFHWSAGRGRLQHRIWSIESPVGLHCTPQILQAESGPGACKGIVRGRCTMKHSNLFVNWPHACNNDGHHIGHWTHAWHPYCSHGSWSMD